MRAIACIVAVCLASIAVLPAAAPPPLHTEVVVNILHKEVRIWWQSDDGAFENAHSAGCHVVDTDFRVGYYYCLGGSIWVEDVRDNGDGTTTYDFGVYAFYGSPFTVELFGPYSFAFVGAWPYPNAFLLHLSWTHAPDLVSAPLLTSAEPVLVGPGSCIGGLCTHGTPFGIGAAVVHPQATYDTGFAAVGTALDVLDCLEEAC